MKFASVFDFIHPDDRAEFAEKRKQLTNKPGESLAFEMRMKHAEGHWIWTEGTITNMLKESGVHALVSNFRDVTQKKHDEQQSEFDRNNLNALINNTPDLMWSVDKNLKLITSNLPFDKLFFGLLGKKLEKGDDILHTALTKERLRLFKTLYKRALSGEMFTEIVSVSMPRGSWSEISFYPILHGHEVIGTACHSRDITQRIISEKKLENQNRELIKANFELDRFVYSVSHDLRSPLTSILGLLSIMEEDTQEPQTLEHTQLIRGRISRLDGFIRNILNYSRNNRTEPEIEPLSLQATVTEVIDSLDGMKEAQDIRFEIAIEETCLFWTDRQSVVTILENIISNAMKFHAPNQLDKYICVKGKTEEDALEMTIEDNGTGIPENAQNRIFDMFYRTSAKAEGTGLGLYIVKEIVEKLGGSIHVTSEENKGTLFQIRLKNLKP